ncbi:branched-chain amino acid ABC transporter permease [Candidatus Geothermarchaeota archaeon]|nr:MAG: branched-chain amino acid ABC transporter permease [Candidatus Geothermarchaeota archaeon]
MFELGVLVSALIDGLSYAMMIFLISIGLIIIFGLMDVFNLAHGAFFGFGAYLFIQFFLTTGDYILSLLIASVAGAVFGYIVERLLIRPLYGKPMLQLLMTMGLMILLFTLFQVVWPAGLYFPEVNNRILSGVYSILGVNIRIYKFVIIIGGVITFIILDIIFVRTRFGAMLRAGTENRELAYAFGINIDKLFSIAFILGSFLAFFGGAFVAPITHATLEVPTTFTLLAFVVPVIGGMKSYRGGFYASLIIGIIDRLVAYYFTWLSFAIDLLIMIIVLIIRPEGLFGGAE